MIGDYTTEMIIHNVSRHDHDAIVKCEVHNDIGKSEEIHTLDVSCKSEKKEILSLNLKSNSSIMK